MKRFLSVLALAALASITASAGPITVDGGWTAFFCPPLPLFPPGAPGGPATGNPFTFTALVPVTLKITEAFISGDRFEVFIDGAPAGLTSLAPTGSLSIGGDFDAAFADPDWSSASYALLAGPHSIEIFSAGFEDGTGAIRVDSVPEPATMTLLGTALGGLALLRRKLA